MSKYIENNNKNNFPNIKIIILGVLLATSIIGGLCYYFARNKKPSEQPEVIEDNQETENKENNNQEIIENNNKENIENQKEEEKQPEIIVNNEYIPVIDCLWLNIPFFVIFSIVAIFFDTGSFIYLKKRDNSGICNLLLVCFITAVVIQSIFCLLWFILMFIFSGFSKIWDKEHSWWSNVKKGFSRNRIYFKGDYFWTFWLLDIITNVIIATLIASTYKTTNDEGAEGEEMTEIPKIVIKKKNNN